MKHSRRASGFSLIELLITVSLIGVTATLGVPSFKRAIQRARNGEAKAYLGGLYQSEKNFSLEFGIYANNLFKIGYKPPSFPEIYTVGFTTGPSCAPRGAGLLRPAAAGVDAASAKIRNAFNNTFVNGMSPSAETTSTPFYRGGSLISPRQTTPFHVCQVSPPQGYTLLYGPTPNGIQADVYDRANPLDPNGVPNGFFATASGVISNGVRPDTGAVAEVDTWAIDHEGTLIHINDGAR